MIRKRCEQWADTEDAADSRGLAPMEETSAAVLSEPTPASGRFEPIAPGFEARQIAMGNAARAEYRQRIEEDGFAVATGCLSEEEILDWANVIETAAAGDADAVRDRGAVYAIRNLFDAVPALRAIAHHPGVLSLVQPILGDAAFLVKGMLFDKSPTANWGVFWHQDLSIPVRLRTEAESEEARAELPEFGPWTRKGGVRSVQPPFELLGRMLTIRLHLDDCGANNGPLRVLAGSHRRRLSDAESTDWSERHVAIECVCPAGAAVVMRPGLLHSSPRCSEPSRRRVLHFEFAAEELPWPLDWHERIPCIPSIRA